MYREKTICVVVPAFNEELLIGTVIETMPDFVDRICIVDDASPDKTVEKVKAHQATTGDLVHLIQHEKNGGVGAAIVTGYKYARDEKYDITVVMAGDAQMAPEDLPDLLDPVVDDRADYSKGNRLFTGEAWHKIPKMRYLGNSMLSLMTKVASGYWNIADSQTGYTAANLTVLETLELDKVFKRYGMPNDFLVRLNIYDFRVLDVPVQPIYGVGEKSGIKYHKAVPRLSMLLWKLFLYRMGEKYIIRDFHPLIFFYLLGFTAVPIATVMGLYLICYRIFQGPVEPLMPIFTAFLFISGLQSAFFGMWFDMEHNRHIVRSGRK
jgi:glycosyltransferase involved in cell wall biosynthesis